MSAKQETTFSTYSKAQGQAYSQIRRDYHQNVYDTVISKHTSSGGQLDLVLDVGCGPGLATRTLASKFAHAVGLDPSSGMIETARSQGLVTATNEPVRFEVSSAENLGASLEHPITAGSIDLITAANAAHWFDLPRFWESAARVLKPGGSVIFWCSGDIRAHPTMPGAKGIDEAVEKHMETYMKPYMNYGNLLTRGRYTDLKLPWSDGAQVPGFDAAHFERYEWPAEQDFFSGDTTIDLDTFEKMRGTSSFTTRWREAHPELVGTEQDAVRVLRRDMEKVLHAAGVKPGEERLKGSVHGVLIIVKKV
ncbi:hypothetical protein AMS68_008055 [Peltaster fructicola]|uniref:Methyltransferase type 11 domain-containing protein n=1 Tax=Peltaster fructicola TaxID=286661 RepID=A0A6H0Y6P5_9PEZI|nr:hypothetical protein AMS68_008055 [Peltaster fructicola]